MRWSLFAVRSDKCEWLRHDHHKIDSTHHSTKRSADFACVNSWARGKFFALFQFSMLSLAPFLLTSSSLFLIRHLMQKHTILITNAEPSLFVAFVYAQREPKRFLFCFISNGWSQSVDANTGFHEYGACVKLSVSRTFSTKRTKNEIYLFLFVWRKSLQTLAGSGSAFFGTSIFDAKREVTTQNFALVSLAGMKLISSE